MPLAAPNSSKARISITRFGATTGAGSNRHSASPAIRVVASLPNRPADQPANGSTSTEPAAIEKSATPSKKSPSPSRSLTSGICGSQLATTKPFAKNTRDADIRECRSRAADAASQDNVLADHRDPGTETVGIIVLHCQIS